MTGAGVPMVSAAGRHVGVAPGTTQPNPVSGAGTTNLHEPIDRSPLRLLVLSSLYPNAVRPRHGVFVEERLRQLVASGRVAATVVAPVPWFPFRSRRFGSYSAFARVPAREERHGVHILHPRYPVIPKLGMNIAPALMYRALLPALRNLVASDGPFDLIDAHYFYPDGVAAARVGVALGRAVVITARGSDINVLPHYRSPRRQIRWAAERAAAIVTVSSALRDAVVALGVTSAKITVLRNGVDLDGFRPLDRAALRAKLDLTGPVWLTVGHLIEGKGVHFAVEALTQVPDATLLVAGTGPEEWHLRTLADTYDVAGRVRFLGAVPHTDLCRFYNVADALLLASAREGMPNVVLESLACGTPAILAPFESAREVITAPEAGEVAEQRSADAIAAAWRRLVARGCDRSATRRFAEQFGWAPVVDAQCALYARVLAARDGAAADGART